MQPQNAVRNKNIYFACFSLFFYLANAPGKGTFVAITPIAGQKENYLRKSAKV
jgi:hypothetical protein